MRIPILGQVAAGRPSEFIPIKSWRSIRPVRSNHWRNRYAGAVVSGDSLLDAGIFDGDIVVFEMTHEAREGDLVVALTPLGSTVKYIFRRGQYVVLRAANPAYCDQVWDSDDVVIQGIVKRVERDL